MIHVYYILIILLLVHICRLLYTLTNNSRKIAMDILQPMYNMIKKKGEK